MRNFVAMADNQRVTKPPKKTRFKVSKPKYSRERLIKISVSAVLAALLFTYFPRHPLLEIQVCKTGRRGSGRRKEYRDEELLEERSSGGV